MNLCVQRCFSPEPGTTCANKERRKILKSANKKSIPKIKKGEKKSAQKGHRQSADLEQEKYRLSGGENDYEKTYMEI